MQRRGFFLLLGATALLVAAALFTLYGERGTAAAARQERVFPDLAARLGDLAWLRVTHGQNKTDFTAVGGRWVVVEKGNYPAAPAKIRKLMLGLADLALIEPKTARPDLYARLDLDDPSNGKSTGITLRDRTGNTVAELIVGKPKRDRLGGGNDAVYVRKPADPRTWLARGGLDLPENVIGWLDRRIADIPPGRLATVTLRAADGTALVLKREAQGGKFAVADPPEGAKFKPDAVLAEPAGALAALDLDDVKPAADLTVPDGGAATAEFVTYDGLTVKLRLAVVVDGAEWLTLEAAGTGAAAEADAKAINDKAARWAYAIPANRAKLLRIAIADLVEPAKAQ